MANYVLIYTGGGMPETEAEQAAVMQAWGAWMGSLGEVLVDGGAPFAGAKTINSNSSVSDGAVGTHATGYSIIAASSLDDAVAKAQGCPILQSGGQISVYETVAM